MVKTASRDLNRWSLLAGVSLLALGTDLAAPRVAEACPTVSGTVTGHTACANWTGSGNFIVNSGFIFGTATPVLSVTVTSGTLTNNGTIEGGGIAIVNASGSNLTQVINIPRTIGSNIPTISANVSAIQNASGATIGTLTNNGTITAGNAAILNSGSIGTLTNVLTIQGNAYGLKNLSTISSINNNSGTISGGSFAGIYNSGTIGTLTNNGMISGAANGIENSGVGTFGPIANAGTISGSANAIANSGTGSIGAITNSGAIIGNILNASTNAFTINGGSGGTFGTLTGSSGTVGTITSTLSNLAFGSGNILLNDNINVGAGHTVTSGAMLQLSRAISITGNYAQSGGGLVIAATNGGASYGSLAVSGNASVSNAAITISGTGLTSGEVFTIVNPGGTGTYSNDTLTISGTSGVSGTLTTVGNTLEVVLGTQTITTTITPPPPVSPPAPNYTAKGNAVGGVAAPIGATLDRIAQGTSPAAVAFQNSILPLINALPAAQQGEAFKQLGPPQNAPAAQMSTTAVTAVLGAVEQHQQTAMAYDPATGIAAGSEEHASALWGQMLGGGAHRDTNAEADGYSLRDFGLATGMDHLFTPNAMGGVALSWVRAWSNGSSGSSGSSSILDSYQLTLYGTYRLDRAFVDGQLGAGWNRFNQKRAIPLDSTMAHADYDGRQYLAAATAGYDFPLGGTTATPLAGLRWLRAISDSYNESGAGADNLFVSKRGINSLTQDLGGKLSWSLATSLGTIKPEVRAAWVHDYTQGAIPTSGLMGGSTFAVTTPRTVADGVRLGLAATLDSTDDLSFRAEYEGELRHQYQSHTGVIKVIWGF